MQAGMYPSAPPEQAAAPLQDPVSAQQVLQVILAALSTANAPRQQAEAMLKGWESDAAPGFLHALLQIVAECGKVDESTRLLATVIAKNAVGSSWRKTLGTREWSRVPPEEKQTVRAMAMSMLMSEPNALIARQLGLLIANIARFDFPTHAETLLLTLIREASWESAAHVTCKLRALKALRDVLGALSTKRFVIEPVRGGLAAPAASPRCSSGVRLPLCCTDSLTPVTSPSLHPPASPSSPPFLSCFGFPDLRSLSHQITLDRELFRKCLSAAFHPLQLLFSYHLGRFLSVSGGASPHPAQDPTGGGGAAAGEWESHGEFTRSAAAAIAELLPLAPDTDGVLPDGAGLLLQQSADTPPTMVELHVRWAADTGHAQLGVACHALDLQHASPATAASAVALALSP
ncbi:MAG: hypothetical protein WDW38_006939 [Sanguina aurantia]